MYYIAKYLINLIHEKSTTDVFYELFRNALHRPFTLPKKEKKYYKMPRHIPNFAKRIRHTTKAY